jgi:hypothetical protein
MRLPLEFRGEGGRIEVEFLGYENPAAALESDANWLKCNATVSVEGFTANSPMSISTEDVERFATAFDAMTANGAGAAVLDTEEEQLRVAIDLRKTGQVTISGEIASRYPVPSARLKFSFESDQTYLVEVSRRVALIREAFPVRQIR